MERNGTQYNGVERNRMKHKFCSIVWILSDGMEKKLPLHHLESERNRMSYNIFIPILASVINTFFL
jgi:hypothetical protein